MIGPNEISCIMAHLPETNTFLYPCNAMLKEKGLDF